MSLHIREIETLRDPRETIVDANDPRDLEQSGFGAYEVPDMIEADVETINRRLKNLGERAVLD